MATRAVGNDMAKFKCFDLETTSVDVTTCEVVQAAVVEADPWPTDGVGINVAGASSRSALFYAATIPAGASAVHGITADLVADCMPFLREVRSFVRALTEPDVVAVTFNGCGFDIPVIARYASRLTGGVYSDPWAEAATLFDDPEYDGERPMTPATIEGRLRRRHIDVMRLWVRARKQQRMLQDCSLHAECFAGTLTGAHAFLLSKAFDGAHDATEDCKATLRVLDAMFCEGFVDVETAIKWSNEPLPGDVDFAGKFKWEGDRAVLTIGKQAGTPIEEVEVGFLRWMLDKDFQSDTKHVVRRFLAGEYPTRDEDAT